MERSSTLPDFDLYRELEVDSEATTETIDAAWRSLVKRHHPDLHSDAGAERTGRLNIAHEWLTDPVRRAQYDGQVAIRRGGHPRPAPSSLHSSGRIGLPSRARRPTPTAVLVYGLWCIGAVVAAYLLSVIVAVILSIANIGVFAAAILGEAGAATAIQLVGNLVFAGALGYLVAAAFMSAFHHNSEDASLVIVGAVAALGFTFGFPEFAASYLPALVDWMANKAGGDGGFPTWQSHPHLRDRACVWSAGSLED